MPKQKDSLTKVIFISWLTTIIALSIIFIVFAIYYKNNDFEGTSISLQKAHIEGYNRTLKSNVQNSIKVIDYITSNTSLSIPKDDTQINKLAEQVLLKYNKTEPLQLSEGNIYILSPEGYVLHNSLNSAMVGKKIAYFDAKGRDFSNYINRLARKLKGNSFVYFKEIENSQKKMKMYCFIKKYDKLNLIVCSEIPHQSLDTAIAMNVRRLKINTFIEMGFVTFIFLLIICCTIFYIHRLSKSIKNELSLIINFLNNIHDKETYHSFTNIDFKFKEFKTIGDSAFLMVKQINKLLKRVGEEAVNLETASQSKTSLFAGLSHDFLVELNTVMGMSQILKYSKLLPEDKEKIEKIFHSASHMASTLHDIETTSLFKDTRSEFKRENINIKQLFGEAIQFVENEAKQMDIDFSYDIDTYVPGSCMGDPVQIRQLIINILRNVISFNEKGAVHLKLVIDSKDKLKLIFTAANKGDGFLGTELDEILSFPNARTKFSMLSLRIAVCNYITKKLKGTFTVSSVKGEGTVYKLCIPLVESTEEEKEDSKIEQLGLDLSRKPKKTDKKILIVEDEPANQDVLCHILMAAGYQTEVAGNGKEAIDLFEKNDIDLILMDCQMPVLNGFKAAKKIRKIEKGKDVAIIAISGCISPNDKTDCFEAGMDAFVAKPFDITKLLQTIKKYVK